MRQVDSFSISACTKDIANEIIESINSKMTIELKPLGVINRFNGVDIAQTRYFIKVHNRTYIEKILRDKNRLDTSIPANNWKYIPMHNITEYNKNIEMAIPISPTELPLIEKYFGFSYKQGIVELMYTLVPCRPDISYLLI